MDNVNEAVSSDKLLEQIFSITQSLYTEMSHPDDDASNDHSAIFRLLTDLGRTLVNADRASFWKWDKRSHELWTTAAVGTGRITIPEGTGLVGKALAEKRTIVTNDPYNHPDFNSDVDKKTGYVTKSILVMPISDCKGEFIGAYQAINKLDNDGKFDVQADTKRLSLAAFICDIDFFKKVNDTYGHNAGDEVLRHVAGYLRRNVRICDGVYRWGGEEFIVILPDTGDEEAAEAAERVRQAIMGSVCHFEGMDIKVTMSFGVTQLDPMKSIEDNIKTADEKLYKAKESGRNTVIL